MRHTSLVMTGIRNMLRSAPSRDTIMNILTVILLTVVLAILAMRNSSPAVSSRVDASQLIGHAPPTLPVLGVTQNRIDSIPFSGTRRIVMLFRTDCPACARTKSAWNRLADSVRSRHTVIALTTEEAGIADGYFESEHTSVRYVINHSHLAASFPINVVPVTIVIGDTGIIEYAKSGILSPYDEAAVLAAVMSQGEAAGYR